MLSCRQLERPSALAGALRCTGQVTLLGTRRRCSLMMTRGSEASCFFATVKLSGWICRARRIRGLGPGPRPCCHLASPQASACCQVMRACVMMRLLTVHAAAANLLLPTCVSHRSFRSPLPPRMHAQCRHAWERTLHSYTTSTQGMQALPPSPATLTASSECSLLPNAMSSKPA